MKMRSLLLSTLLVLPLSVSATTLKTTDESFLFEQKSDRYEFGSKVSVPLPFSGDVLLLGETVTVDEPVSGNVQAAGQTVIINTTVGQNVRVAGNSIILRGIINGSVLAMGADITVQKGAVIRGDLTALGANVTIEGDVNGNIFLRSESADIEGRVNGGADVRGEHIGLSGLISGNATLVAKDSFTITQEGVHVGGNLEYWNRGGEQNTTLDEAVAGQVTFNPDLRVETEDHSAEGAVALGALAGIIGLFGILSAALTLLVLIPLIPKLQMDAAKQLQKHPWQSFFTAVAFFIGLPILAVILFITVFGIPLGAVVLLKFIAGLILARVLASLVLARWIELHYKKRWNGWIAGLVALLCYIILHVLNIIPVVGWVVTTWLICAGFGALMSAGWEKARKIL